MKYLKGIHNKEGEISATNTKTANDKLLWRMPSSGMWRRVVLVWTNVSEEPAWAGGCRVCSHLLTLVPRSRIFLPWRWRRCVPPKRQLTLDLHGATSQKTTFFIVTAVKTSDLTWWCSSLILNVLRLFYLTQYYARKKLFGSKHYWNWSIFPHTVISYSPSWAYEINSKLLFHASRQ
jgi:hypothetical protein